MAEIVRLAQDGCCGGSKLGRRGQPDIAVCRNTQVVGGRYGVPVNEHLNNTRVILCVTDVGKCFFQGIVRLSIRLHAADVLGHVEELKLFARLEGDKVCVVRAVLPDLVFCVIADGLDILRDHVFAVIHGGVVGHIVLILGQIVDALGVQCADEAIIAVSALGDGIFVIISGDAEIGQRRDCDSAVLVRMSLCLALGRAGLNGQGDALVGDDNGGRFVHGVDFDARPLHIVAVKGDGCGIVRVLRGLGDSQLRAGRNRHGLAAVPIRGQGEAHAVILKVSPIVAFNTDTARVQHCSIGVFRILGIVDQIPRLLIEHHIVGGQDREDAGLVGDVIVFGSLAEGCCRNNVGAGRLAGGTGDGKGKLRLRLALAGVGIGPGSGFKYSLRLDLVIVIDQLVEYHGELGVRGDGISQSLNDVDRRNGELRAVDGQKAGFVGHFIVALCGLTSRRDDVGAHILARLAAEGVGNCIALTEAGDLRLPGGIVAAVGLALVLGLDGDLLAFDGEGAADIGNGIVALRLCTRDRDGILAHRFPFSAGNRVFDNAGRILVFEAINCDGESGLCLSIGFTDIVRRHSHRGRRNGEIVVDIGDFIVALLCLAGDGDAVAALLLADIAVGIVGDRVPFFQASDFNQRRVGIAIDLCGGALYGHLGGGDGQFAIIQTDAVALLAGVARKHNGIAAHILPFLAGACEGDLFFIPIAVCNRNGVCTAFARDRFADRAVVVLHLGGEGEVGVILAISLAEIICPNNDRDLGLGVLDSQRTRGPCACRLDGIAVLVVPGHGVLALQSEVIVRLSVSVLLLQRGDGVRPAVIRRERQVGSDRLQAAQDRF